MDQNTLDATLRAADACASQDPAAALALYSEAGGQSAGATPRQRRALLYGAAAAFQDLSRSARRDAPAALRALQRLPDVGGDELRLIRGEIARLFDPHEQAPPVGRGPIPDPTGPFYIICMTPRSGSTFLARCMTEMGILGRPGEYLHRNEPTAMPGIVSRFRVPTLDDYIWRVIRHSQTANGVCGIKTELSSLLPLLVEGTFARVVPHAHFIYLTREDVTMQAVSLAKAQITGAWNDRVQPEDEARYDFERILTALHYTTGMTARWETVFALYGLKPLRITYEAIDRDVDAVIAAIVAAIGIEVAPTTFKTRRHSVQRDNISAAWRARFMAEFESRSI